jgi:hypothetical protein
VAMHQALGWRWKEVRSLTLPEAQLVAFLLHLWAMWQASQKVQQLGASPVHPWAVVWQKASPQFHRLPAQACRPMVVAGVPHAARTMTRALINNSARIGHSIVRASEKADISTHPNDNASLFVPRAPSFPCSPLSHKWSSWERCRPKFISVTHCLSHHRCIS